MPAHAARSRRVLTHPAVVRPKKRFRLGGESRAPQSARRIAPPPRGDIRRDVLAYWLVCTCGGDQPAEVERFSEYEALLAWPRATGDDDSWSESEGESGGEEQGEESAGGDADVAIVSTID